MKRIETILKRMRDLGLLRAMLAVVLVIACHAVLPGLASAQITDEDVATLFEDAGGNAGKGATLGTGPSVSEMLIKMTIALGVVLGLIAGGLWAMRKFVPKSRLAGGGSAIRVLANHSLGQRRSVMMVRVQDKTLVLGVTPHTITCLSELGDEVEYDQWHATAHQAALASANLPPEPRGFGGTTDFGGRDQ